MRGCLLLVALVAPACGDNKVTATSDTLSVTPAALDFPRTRVANLIMDFVERSQAIGFELEEVIHLRC